MIPTPTSVELRARRPLGAYRIPLETGLLIPSEKLIGTWLQLSLTNAKWIRGRWLSVSLLCRGQIQSPKVLAVKNIEPHKILGWLTFLQPSDPRERSLPISRFFDPNLLSDFPQPARCDANSPLAHIDRVRQLLHPSGIRFAIDENGHVSQYPRISLNPFIQLCRRQR